MPLAEMLRGGAQSEMPMEDRPMSRAERLREWLASRRQQPQMQQFPPGKDGITPLERPDLNAQPGRFGQPGNGPYGQPGMGGDFTMNPLGPGGLEGLPPGIMAILAARMGREDGPRFPPGKDGITPLEKPMYPPGKDGVTPLMVNDRSLMGGPFGKKPGGY